MSIFKLKTALVVGVIATNLFASSAFAADKKEAKTTEKHSKSEIALANDSTEPKVVKAEDSETAQQKRDRENLKKSVSRYVADFYVSAY